MGVHDTPAFSVFQTPPDPAATYQTLESSGSQSISEMRPDINAGPRLRHFSPLKSKLVSSLAATELMMSPVASAAEKSLSVNPRTIVILQSNDRFRLATRSQITNAIRSGSQPISGSLIAIADEPQLTLAIHHWNFDKWLKRSVLYDAIPSSSAARIWRCALWW